MKKILPFIAALMLCGCSAEQTEPQPSQPPQNEIQTGWEPAETNEAPQLTEIYEEVKTATDIGETAPLPDEAILNTYGIDTETLTDYIFAESASMETVDAFIAVKCDNPDEIKQTFENLLSYKKAELENYNPEQFAVYDKSIINVSNDCAYWIVSEDAENIESVLLEKLN